MSNYHLKPPADMLLDTVWQEKKAAHKMLLEGIRRQRAERYK